MLSEAADSSDPARPLQEQIRLIPRYPISAERIPDRRGFKFTAENVAMLLQAQGNP